MEEVVIKKDQELEQLQVQVAATYRIWQQQIEDRVTEGLNEREKELRDKYSLLSPWPCLLLTHILEFEHHKITDAKTSRPTFSQWIWTRVVQIYRAHLGMVL